MKGVHEIPSRHLCPRCLLLSVMLSWGSFSYFDPEHKASFVLRIKGGEGFEEQGSISWHALQLFICFLCTMTKINFCYHTTVLAIWFSIVWQFDNSIPRHEFVQISHNARLESDCAFSLVVANSVCLFVLFCFYVFLFFVFFTFFLVTNRFY